jgi:TolB-like protein
VTRDVFKRLRERKLVQWALAYVAGAWAVLQVIGLAADSYEWPHQVMQAAFAVIALGFVIMLVLAWYHGERGAQRVTGTELLILALLLAIGGGLLWRFGHVSSAPDDASVAATRSADAAQRNPGAVIPDSVAAATSSGLHIASAPPVPIPAKSIAVLAFSDLSPGHDQGYFSDGMSEEILNALAQIKDLKVAGRTSSFYYKGKNEDLRTIGKALGVANVLEGSVRKQGNAVRITAQLVRVADDTELWSHAYDGDLSDVFKLQENIARAITGQLQVVLVGEQKTRLVQVGTTNTEAYNLYLHATDALNRRDYKAMGDAVGWLRQAIALDPGFAQAHARLAMIHVLGQKQYGASEVEAQQQAQLALMLDPNLAEAHYALSLVARQQRRFMAAREASDRAVALAPDDASANLYAAQLLIMTGYTRQGIARLDHALAIDPLLPNALHWRAVQYLEAGDLDAAERLWKRAGQLGLSFTNAGLALLAKERGDYAKARALTLPYLLGVSGYTECLKTRAVSAPIFLAGIDGGDAQARATALAVVDECLAAKPAKVPYWVASGLLQLDPKRALPVIAQGPTTDEGAIFMRFWGAQGRAARQLPEFAAFARKVGFAALWDKYGPPDECNKNAEDDYVCTR